MNWWLLSSRVYLQRGEKKSKNENHRQRFAQAIVSAIIAKLPLWTAGLHWCSIHGGCQQHKGRWLLSSWSPDMVLHNPKQLKCT